MLPTIFVLLVLIALVMLLIHVASGKVPLWISVLFVIIALLVNVLPK